MSEQMRTRLRALADEAEPGLTASQLDAIAETVRKHGPAQMRHAKLRTGATIGAAVVAAAATALLVVRTTGGFDEAADTNGVVTDVRGCASGIAPVLSANQVDLQSAGRVAFEGNLNVEWTPCEWTLSLGDGRVRVEADDLGGGRLRVLAGDTRVTVRGTVFTVVRSGDQVQVEVEEGHVEVAQPDWTTTIHGGQRVGHDGVVTALEARVESEAETRTAPVAPVELAESEREARGSELTQSAGELAIAAERLRQAGEFDAAAVIFRRAGALRGADAEASLLALARMQHGRGRTNAALRALRTHQRRFAHGVLSAEVAGLGFRIARDAERDEDARRFAEQLQRDHAGAPHAAGTSQWLDAH